MEKVRLSSFPREQVTSRICMVSSFSTELLEIKSKESLMHILIVPGNPGIVGVYKDFVEALYENLGGQASITAIGHISHSEKDFEQGRLFSMNEQIDHKVDFIEQELQNSEQPIILVGHSIGSYICLEIFKRLQQQVKFVIGLYPFVTLNKNSIKQSIIGLIARSSLLNKAVTSFASFIRSLRPSVSRTIVRRLLGPSWSVTAVDAVCSHFLQLSEEPVWTFMRTKQDQIALLFGVDDHWGPLSLLEEISKHAPGIAVSIEREGHTHNYCCTEAGSLWVANYVAILIRNHSLIRNK